MVRKASLICNIFIILFFFPAVSYLDGKEQKSIGDGVVEATYIYIDIDDEYEGNPFTLNFTNPIAFPNRSLPDPKGAEKKLLDVYDRLDMTLNKGNTVVVVVTARKITTHDKPYDNLATIKLILEIPQNVIGNKTSTKLIIPNDIKIYLHADFRSSPKSLYYATKGQLFIESSKLKTIGKFQIELEEIYDLAPLEKHPPIVKLSGIFHFEW